MVLARQICNGICTLDVCPIEGCAGNEAHGQSLGNRYLIAEVRDADGNLMGMNFTYVFQNQSSARIEINGFGMMGPNPFPYFDGNLDLNIGTCRIDIANDPCGMKFSLFRYQGFHDYGLPSGTYTIRVYMRGFISGNMYGFTWSDELRTVSWANVVFTSAAGNLTFDAGYSWDAFYGVYLDAGQYQATVIVWSPAGQGYTIVKVPVSISTGQSTTGVTFQLERSNIPIPEFSGLAIVAFSALAASLYLLRRKRR